VILFYSDIVENEQIFLTGEEHAHCTKVMRRAQGDTINVTDGKGNIYLCEITQSTRTQTTAKIREYQVSPPLSKRFAVGLSILKNPSRTEWFVEKAVEIGISDFYFYQSTRTEGKSINQPRLQKIIISAGKQSMNVIFPTIHFFSSFEPMLQSLSSIFEQRFIAHCNGVESHLITHLKKPNTKFLLIGPEGDFTDKEVSMALQYGFQEVSLGSSRLRSETAALVGLTAMHLSRM